MEYFIIVPRGISYSDFIGAKLVVRLGVTVEQIEDDLSANPVYLPFVEFAAALRTGVVDGIVYKTRQDADAAMASLEPSLAMDIMIWNDGHVFTNGDNDLVGTEGADHVDLLGGRDWYDGYGGDDVVHGGAGMDRIRGGADNDLLLGEAGRDRLWGEGGQDDLRGGAGHDRLNGGGGADILNGGKGNDRLIGGHQDDTFVFKGSFGQDRIVDFDATSNREKIDLSGVGAIKGFKDLRNHHAEQQGQDVIIEDGSGNSILLLGVDLSDLGAGDFIF